MQPQAAGLKQEQRVRLYIGQTKVFDAPADAKPPYFFSASISAISRASASWLKIFMRPFSPRSWKTACAVRRQPWA